MLTAAHCLEYWSEYWSGDLDVIVGAFRDFGYDPNNGGQEYEIFRMVDFVIHPDYGNVDDNDVALIRLDGSSTITPVPLDASGLSETYSTGKKIESLILL